MSIYLESKLLINKLNNLQTVKNKPEFINNNNTKTNYNLLN